MKYITMICCLVCVVGWGCSPESGVPRKESGANAPKALAKKAAAQPGVLSRIPPFAPDMDVDGLKKMQALRTNSTGLKFRAQGEHARSIDAFIAALKDNPGNQLIRYNLATSLLMMGDTANALAVLHQFAAAKDCKDCFVVLARAKTDPLWASQNQNGEFIRLVSEPARHLESALAESNWISLDEKALEKKELKFTFQGLPAISRDGTRIVGARILYDTKGRPQELTMHMLDAASGERLHGQRILFESEAMRIYTDKMNARETMRLVENRVTYFNTMMLAHDWDKVSEVSFKDTSADRKCETAQQLTAAGKQIGYQFPSLKIINEDGTAAYEGNVDQWLKSENKVCATHVRIQKVYYHPEHQTFVFELGYCSAQCEAPNRRWVSVRIK